MPHLEHILEDMAALAAIIALLLPFTFRWFMRINATYNFSVKLSTNHLPHIYRVQKLIAKRLNIDVPDDPPIQDVAINGHKD